MIKFSPGGDKLDFKKSSWKKIAKFCKVCETITRFRSVFAVICCVLGLICCVLGLICCVLGLFWG